MINVYVLDASTYAALTRACAALTCGTNDSAESGRLIEVLLARATLATLEMDGEKSCLN